MVFDVVIVGAGASGLAAARKISERGVSVAVIEAGIEPGGRIRTIHSPLHVEAGAEFIHGDAETTFRLLKESGSTCHKLEGKLYSIYHNHLSAGDEREDEREDFVDALKQLKTDTTVSRFLETNFKHDKEIQDSVKGFVEGFDAADTERMSAFALRDEWQETDEDEQYRIDGGYGPLINYLLEETIRNGGQIFNSSPVTRIDWEQNHVSVAAGERIIKARKVLVTVSIGVLQKERIRFQPDIPDYMEATKQIGNGGVIKFHFMFKDRIWQRSPRALKDLRFVFTDARVPTWWSQLPDETPLLTGWLGGPNAFKTSPDKNLLYQRALESLSYILQMPRTDIEAALENYVITDWTTDPFTCGAYSYPTPETGKARKKLVTPVANTLYFAGEALDDGTSIGTVEAALRSGETAAEKILASFQ